MEKRVSEAAARRVPGEDELVERGLERGIEAGQAQCTEGRTLWAQEGGAGRREMRRV